MSKLRKSPLNAPHQQLRWNFVLSRDNKQSNLVSKYSACHRCCQQVTETPVPVDDAGI
jgi:hypothetical protein